MEGRKQVGSQTQSPSLSSNSSSSLASELFGSRDGYPAASSSTGIFGSIFGPPSNAKVMGKEFMRSDSERKREFLTDHWGGRSETPADDTPKSGDEGSQSAPNSEMGTAYQEQRAQPCHLSSSIFYGGQENYSNPQNPHGSSTNKFKKDQGEDDPGSASRGNWWQGSLYY